MIELINAICALNSQVVRTVGDIAYDAEGNEVAYNKAAVEAYVASQAYVGKRQAEYPPITDYLDAIVKADQAQLNAYISACKAVKDKYPK